MSRPLRLRLDRPPTSSRPQRLDRSSTSLPLYLTAACLFPRSLFSLYARACSYVYLPVFFQLVKQETASQSGAALIPMMLGLPIGAIICGALVTLVPQWGYRIYPVIGSALVAIANGLYMTMTVTSPSYQLVGNLILGGLGSGPNVQGECCFVTRRGFVR